MTTITAPLTTITLQGLAPDVVRSCIVQQPSPPPDPGETPPPPITAEGIYTPVAPGVTYGSLPTVSIVDTRPDQMIGCIIDTADNPQGRLNALFPSAIDGDGVIERSTNDIWVFDGATWNNVGPTPGPTIVTAQVVPPWNEIVVYDARVRTRLEVNGLAYALELLTEPAAYGITLGLQTTSIRKVTVPVASTYDIDAFAPQVTNPYTSFIGVAPVIYSGTGTTRSISTLPWSPGLVWIKARGPAVGSHAIFDQTRGPLRSWSSSGTVTEGELPNSLTSFDAKGFTLGSSTTVNSATQNYASWSFAPIGEGQSNTDGTITTTVYKSQPEFYSIVRYTGNGSASQSIGHGLGELPAFVIIRRIGGSGSPVVGGSALGDGKRMLLNTTATVSTSVFGSHTTTTVGLTADSNVNESGASYAAYVFKNVQGLCKAGTYVGDGAGAGQFIACGFTPRLVIVRSTDLSESTPAGNWNLLDILRDTEINRLYANSTAIESNTTKFYELSQGGFTGVGTLNYSTYNYIYIAFGGFTPTVIPPTGSIDLLALPPTV